jgi:hypothetical protein
MRPTFASAFLLLAVACGDDASVTSESGLTSHSSGAVATSTAGETTAGSGPTTAGSTTAGSGPTTAIDDGASTGVDPSDDTGAMGTPIVLYEGPVVGGVVPGWDPDAPRPLIMLGQLLDQWIVTLARIDGDGSLSDNVAQQIIVWGWEQAPPLLYDGPVIGGAIPSWSADDPTPVVMMGYDAANATWVATLASIAADGSLGDNVSDRIIVWGWSDAALGAPDLRYSGPIAGGELPGWNPGAPEPLVMLARFSGEATWQSTLVSIGPGGELRGNVADELMAWGW